MCLTPPVSHTDRSVDLRSGLIEARVYVGSDLEHSAALEGEDEVTFYRAINTQGLP